ncbi:uncharacterized protein MONOS_8523 [Monocercomonoides exilis]|uniref:uncharacterized protein n=1 Tax=Monocercomonoides exilis TaxID=2049356 RepID=UPI00355996F5|nr:hypothetical protein MONOS_8523 [Monocercomonoides exilis]|eukprot:MONOS_8523.1-p1 / transcript=MONOS_8523.1 / gene=MONOS_8523 / organism=Monocercomonoides_exilis_PA203 / gene_product=unspecified product / transcript_product=unspecified product / location=Mono_scaffold00324:3579-4497(+) / protein_length=148 / sequence_SO=supercontig / SO=protein_coding / is_pseudo=false
MENEHTNILPYALTFRRHRSEDKKVTVVFDQRIPLFPCALRKLWGVRCSAFGDNFSFAGESASSTCNLQPSTAQLVFRSAQSRSEGADGAAGGDEEEHRAQLGGVVSVLGPCEKNQEKIAVIIKYGSAVVLVAHTSGKGVVVKLGVE